MIFLAMAFMGLLVALVSVFLGLGGGILLVPLLPNFFNLSIHQAVATSVTTIFMAVCLNTYFFHREKLVKWPVVLLMGPPSAVSAFLAALVSQKVDPQVILIFLGVVLGAIALKNLKSVKDYKVEWPLSRKQKNLGILGGVLGGIGSGFGGIGSGAILSPTMILLKMVKAAQLSPTANANMVCTTFGAVVSYALSIKGSDEGGSLIQWEIALGIFIFSQIFAFFLRPHQNRLPFQMKSTILNILLIGLAIKIGWMAYMSN